MAYSALAQAASSAKAPASRRSALANSKAGSPDMNRLRASTPLAPTASAAWALQPRAGSWACSQADSANRLISPAGKDRLPSTAPARGMPAVQSMPASTSAWRAVCKVHWNSGSRPVSWSAGTAKPRGSQAASKSRT